MATAVKELDSRVAQLETYFKIGLGVAVILGVSGGWLGKTVYETHQVAAEAKLLAGNAQGELQTATTTAIQTVRTTAGSAVTQELEAQVRPFISAQFTELSNRIGLTFGAEHMGPYVKLNQSFDQKCPAGSAMTGWGFGQINNDIRIFCHPLSVTR